MAETAEECFGPRRPKHWPVPRAAARYSSAMSEVLDMAAIAALIGDPARANILCALLDGRALTASEFALRRTSLRRPRAAISASSQREA